MVSTNYVVTKKGARHRTSPVRIARTTMEAECLRLRAKGYTCSEIAEMIGMTGNRASEKVNTIIYNALERKGKPEASDVRNDLYDRLDKLYNRAARIAVSDAPDRVAALNAAVSISSRMAALTGADAPKQVDLHDDRQLPADPATRKKFLEDLARKAAAEGDAGSEGS